MIIEICPYDPLAIVVDWREEHEQDLLDCTGPGDAQEACEYVRDRIGVEFRIVAKNANGVYKNRKARKAELKKTCRAIYFDSDADFSDPDTCATYLIWEAANNFSQEGKETI